MYQFELVVQYDDEKRCTRDFYQMGVCSTTATAVSFPSVKLLTDEGGIGHLYHITFNCVSVLWMKSHH